MAQSAPVLWFTGLSGAGKTTIASEVIYRLQRKGVRAELLDGDEIRSSLSSDLGFSRQDRDLQVQRIGWIANLLSRNNVVVLVSAISPYREARNKALAGLRRGLEIFIDAPLETVEKRDTKGLYKKARAGEIKGFTGIDDPYEHPEFPELRINTAEKSLQESVEEVLTLLVKEGVIESV
jgi:adenylylsulfate kinase